MAYKENKTGSHSIVTTESSKFFDKTTGKITTINESWTATETQRELTEEDKRRESKESWSQFWGISRYFVVICLIIFFIAPVYTELNNNWNWTVTKEEKINGAIVHYSYTNNKTTEDYIELGNNMLSGFVDTMDTIGNVVNITDNALSSFDWLADIYNNTIGKVGKVILDFISSLFGN